VDKWPSLGKYYRLPEDAGSELYPEEARLHLGKTGMLDEWLGETPWAPHMERNRDLSL